MSKRTELQGELRRLKAARREVERARGEMERAELELRDATAEVNRLEESVRFARAAFEAELVG